MIDVALGLALLYAVLSLFVTTIQEYVVNSAMRWRSRHMKKTVSSAFGEDQALTRAFFEHPLIVSMADGKGGRAPSYIPEDVFAKVFLAVLGHGNHPKVLGFTPAGFMASLRPAAPAVSDPAAAAVSRAAPVSTALRRTAGTPGGADFVASLRLATADSAGLRGGAGGSGDWTAFEADIARWFADIGERSKGWFKRSSQRWTLLIALIITVGLNADSIMIARTLWGDAEMRKQLADMAVVVDTVRSVAAGASAPRAVANTDTLTERYTQVQNDVRALITQLKDDAFISEKSFFTLTCTGAETAKCQDDAVYGAHCAASGQRPAAAVTVDSKSASTPACRKPVRADLAGYGVAEKGKSFTPALLWLDQVYNLERELATGRAESTAQGRPLRLDDRLIERVAVVQRSLAAIGSDMGLIQLKTPDPKGKASRTLDALRLDVQALHARTGELFRFVQPSSEVARAKAECGMQFEKDSPLHDACIERRQAQQPFPLPLGFEPSVLARQVSTTKLSSCSLNGSDGTGRSTTTVTTSSITNEITSTTTTTSAGTSTSANEGCGTFSLLGDAALNGALVGWLLTAVALSLGAPFWFDTLGRLVKLRASGVSSDEKKATTAPAPSPTPGPSDKAGSAPASAPGPGLRPASGTTDVTSKLEATLSIDEIREVQRKLLVPATGVFDDTTRTAIQERRAQLGMSVGAELDGALYEAIIQRRSLSVAARPTLKRDERNELIPDLRDRLVRTLGIPAQARGEGDVFDDKLHAAVRLLQGRAGLAPDGVIGDQTWRIIDSGGGLAVDADRWMSRAISQLGLNETTDKEEVRKFLAALNLEQEDPENTPWCACFVAWVIQEVGPKPPTKTPEGAGNWEKWGRVVGDDSYGAVVLLRETKVGVKKTPQNHVAFLVGKMSNGWVVLGGNQGQRGDVSVTLFPSDSYEIVRCAMPGDSQGGVA